MAKSGIPQDLLTLMPSADLRYVGQAYEIRVTWPSFETKYADLFKAVALFHEAHQRLYSFSTPERAVEMISLRVTAVGRVAKPDLPKLKKSYDAPSKKTERVVVFREAGEVMCPVYERARLTADQTVMGPAIVEQPDSTTLIPPDWSGVSDEFGHLILTRGKEVLGS